MKYDLPEYRQDLERYERELAEVRKHFPEDHPLVQLWVRRRRTCKRMIEHLEERQ